MTEDELKELISDCPTLYHMAERGSWTSIKDRGLMSTTALLDLYRVDKPQRKAIESKHRPSSVELRNENLPSAIVRDQIPMSDSGLERCLPAHLTPKDWYELLNAKVFFWLTEDRLHRLTGAKAYRDREHDVLEVDTGSLIQAYRDSIWLCPMNSGCTKPVPHPRNENTFLRISEYPYHSWRKKRAKGERVVELAVDYSVPDISNHIKRVLIVRGKEIGGIVK